MVKQAEWQQVWQFLLVLLFENHFELTYSQTCLKQTSIKWSLTKVPEIVSFNYCIADLYYFPYPYLTIRMWRRCAILVKKMHCVASQVVVFVFLHSRGKNSLRPLCCGIDMLQNTSYVCQTCIKGALRLVLWEMMLIWEGNKLG